MSFYNILSKATNLRVPRTSLKTFLRTAVCQERSPIMEPCCKTALITGGAEGIGLATAHQLLCAKAKHVVLLGLDISKGLDAVNALNCTYGKDKATFMKFDVTDDAVIKEVFGKIKSKFKKVEIFVNCAGKWDEKNWESQTRTNFEGTVRFTYAVLHHFEKTAGVVINFSGVMGLATFPPSPVFSADCISIVRYCQCLGHEANFRRVGMRIIALCTGVTTCTDFTKDVENRMRNPDMIKMLKSYINEAHKQKPDSCGKAVIELIKFAGPGSVWIIEDSRLTVMTEAKWREQCVLVSQFT